MANDDRPTVLVTGATGFIGRHLVPALAAAGWRPRCASRDARRAELASPDREWVSVDLDEPSTVPPALAGCDAAVYLVHGMGAGGDYPERERRAALEFRVAAEAAGVRRVVYLGGVAPSAAPSRHLASRIATGELLRGGALDTVELRAALIIGTGGGSWLIVRDLARRLPMMLLPAWLQNHSWPVGVEDVVIGIIAALRPEVRRGWYDLPGPERLSHQGLLRRVCAVMGSDPIMLPVPVITPRLSSYWIRLVTRADAHLATELVEGLRSDLDPSGTVLWSVVPGLAPTRLDDAIRAALADEKRREVPTAEMVERLVARASSWRAPDIAGRLA